MPEPQILHGRVAGDRLKRGFDTLTNLLAVTLGPTQGVILSKHETHATPELLTDSATVARRVLALPERAEDVGAMIARNMVWRMHMRAGDGCATTAVLASAMLDQAHRYVAAGANPMSIRRGMNRAAHVAVDALVRMARPVNGGSDLLRVAQTITNDAALSTVLGEIFARLGPDAHVTIEDYLAPYLERQYYEGGRWNAHLASPYFISDQSARRAVIAECHVALCAGVVTTVDDIAPLLKIVAGTDWKQVLLIANEISGAALATLVLNHRQGNLKIIAAELREPETKRLRDLDDLAILTGAEVISAERGRSLSRIEPSDLGAAPRVEADAQELIVVGGEGDAAAVLEYANKLRTLLSTLPEGDDERKELQFRLARLSGQVCKLMLGAHTETERAFIRQQAEKAIRALPIALREGLVPGGGIALLNCIPAVCELQAEGDDALGIEAVRRALEEPFRRIVTNAGLSAPGALMAEALRRGPAYGWNAETGELVSMEEAGILDAAGVLREALQIATSGATMALTTDTLVLKRNPQITYEP